jgi:small subunit ribosomal protein S16
MVVIRLSRGGSKKRPFYNIVVLSKRTAVTAVSWSAWASTTRWLPATLKPCACRWTAWTHWVKTGAQASDAVNRLIVEAKKAAVPAA